MSKPSVMSVFELLRLVRDARSTRNAPRELLYALALRCRPHEKFIAWPSYVQLAKDTLLDEVTLKRAAKKLEDAKLIKRVVRRNRSNCFYINAALLQEQAAAVKSADEAAKNVIEDVDEAPFADPILKETVDENAADHDTEDYDVMAAITGGAR